MIDGRSNAERIQKREHVVGARHQFGSVLANEGVTASRTHRCDRAGNSEYRAGKFGRLSSSTTGTGPKRSLNDNSCA
jgi:hypothetical protein